MPAELHVDKARLRKMESFFADAGYKEYLENACSFNRKLNEERKMRIPYIDGQTGVAQRHYDTQRGSRQRMPPEHRIRRGGQPGQVLTYPRKAWKKRTYQYLKFFMQPRGGVGRGLGGAGGAGGVYDPESEMHVISQIENPSLSGGGAVGANGAAVGINEDSMGSASGKDEQKGEWAFYEDEMFDDDDGGGGGGGKHDNSDSDYDYEDYASKKKKGKAKGGKAKGGSKSGGGGGGGSGGTPAKRRTHADNIPDSEKPFACELCGARYKTRPGLTYHYKNSHKDRDPSIPVGGYPEQQLQQQQASPTPPHQQFHGSSGGSVVMAEEHYAPLEGGGRPPSGGATNSSLTPPSTPDNAGDSMDGSGRQSSRRSAPVNYRESDLGIPFAAAVPPQQQQQQQQYQMPPQLPAAASVASSASSSSECPIPQTAAGQAAHLRNNKTMSGKERAPSLGYCDFCLGDARENKKTSRPEELVSCAECGRSGHPTCLQFTANMVISVKEYPWQCIECKCCTLCGTSENDDQLLFCDDCDRGYHMYCLVPPIKEPPEGSWSCKLCIERFHRKA